MPARVVTRVRNQRLDRKFPIPETRVMRAEVPNVIECEQPRQNDRSRKNKLYLLNILHAHDTAINGGLHWRVYADKPDQSGVFRLLKEDSSAQPTFVLPAGNYIVHVAFGLASTAKPVQINRDATREGFCISHSKFLVHDILKERLLLRSPIHKHEEWAGVAFRNLAMSERFLYLRR